MPASSLDTFCPCSREKYRSITRFPGETPGHRWQSPHLKGIVCLKRRDMVATTVHPHHTVRIFAATFPSLLYLFWTLIPSCCISYSSVSGRPCSSVRGA